MAKKRARSFSYRFSPKHLIISGVILCLAVLSGIGLNYFLSQKYNSVLAEALLPPSPPPIPPLDKAEYDRLMLVLANNPVVKSKATTTVSSTTLSTATSTRSTSTASSTPSLWPVNAVYPNPGALLPFNRIVAYYGNLYSKQMGVLGQYPRPEMLAKLLGEVQKWQEADPTVPVIPALHYIVVTAQASAGDDGKYRARMPFSEIDKVLDMATEIHGIVFLDFQVALSDLQTELPVYEKYLKMPNVHLGIDPEFSMKRGGRPGTVIGTFDASDVNYAANYLAQLVRDNNLPPKILIVHRFTAPMVTNYKDITPLPEVQIVMDMDGWGPPSQKMQTYFAHIYSQPVQFTGFKLFYRNDISAPPNHMMTPEEVLKLRPIPSYIQYQ